MVSGSAGSKFESSICWGLSSISSFLETEVRGMDVVVVVVDIVAGSSHARSNFDPKHNELEWIPDSAENLNTCLRHCSSRFCECQSDE